MPGNPPPPFDPTVPSDARVWDYWLGGHVNYDADRAAARTIEETVPGAPVMAARSRQFLERAVAWTVRQGIIQSIDLGAGIPTISEVKLPDGREVRVRPVHEIAREAAPHARAVYVDRDDAAVSQAWALLSGPGVAVVRADIAGPAAVLADPGLRAVIDLSRPACLIFSCVLHYFPPGQARDIVAGYARRVAPGSYVIVSAIAGGPRIPGVRSFARDDIEALFAGLDLPDPGVLPARAWRGGAPDPGLRPRGPVHLLAAVGRVP